MSFTANDIRRAVRGYYNGLNDSGFDEWLESHDAEVRNEAIIARDTRTHTELARELWDRSHPCNGERIPPNTPMMELVENPDGTRRDYHVYANGRGDEWLGNQWIRTLSPLPPLIPEGTPAVWASTEDCDGRRVLVLSEEPIGNMLRYWRDGDGDEYRDEQLIDPVPIPKEGDR